MDKGEIIISVCLTLLTVIIIPSVSWLVKKIIIIDRDFVVFKAQAEKDIATIYANCERRQAWASGIQKSINRTDRNIQSVCQNLQISDYERPD